MKIKTMILVAAAASSFGASAFAQSGDEPFVGQVIFTAAKSCPPLFLPADGRTLPLSGNVALALAIGGEGATTLTLPDLRDVAIVGAGHFESATAPRDVAVGSNTSEKTVDSNYPANKKYATSVVKLLPCIAYFGTLPRREY